MRLKMLPEGSIIGVSIALLGIYAGSDASPLKNNQHDEHSRNVDDIDGTTNAELLPTRPNIINNRKDVNTDALIDKQVIYDGNGDVTRYFDIDKQQPNGKEKEYLLYTANKYNDNKIGDEIGSKYDDTNFTTMYLAGYDDQIFKLQRDIQNHGIGHEILVYFYLYTNNAFQNIGNLYTDKAVLSNCILKYPHFFCVGHNKNDCVCIKNLQKVKEKPSVQTEAEVNNVVSTNKAIDITSANEEMSTAQNNEISVTENTFHSETRATGLYEEVQSETVHNKSNTYIDAQSNKDISENAILNNNVVSITPKLEQQNDDYPTVRLVNTESLEDLVNGDNLNNEPYVTKITEKGTDEDRQTLVKNLPSVNSAGIKINSILQPTIQLTNDFKSQIPIRNVENLTTNLLIDAVTEINDEINSPKVNETEYVIYPKNIPEQNANTNTLIQTLPYDNDVYSNDIDKITDLNSNFENPNVIIDIDNILLNDENINSVANNEDIGNIIGTINTENKEDFETNNKDSEIIENKGDIVNIDNISNPTFVSDPIKLHLQHNNGDILSTGPTYKTPDIVNGVLTPDAKINEIMPDIVPTVTVKADIVNNKGKELPNYKDSNKDLQVANIPFVATENYGINKKPATNVIYSQLPYNNIHVFENSNQCNFPNKNKNKDGLQVSGYNKKYDVLRNWPYILGNIYGYDYASGKEKINLSPRNYFPEKYVLSPCILRPLLSQYKNIITYLEPVTKIQPENIVDVIPEDLDEKSHNESPENVQFREEISHKNVDNLTNYDRNQIYISPYKHNKISNLVTYIPNYPYTGEKFINYQPKLISTAYYMQDPCNYKNIQTLEGNIKPNYEKFYTAASKELVDNAEPFIVKDHKNAFHQHVDEESLPTNNNNNYNFDQVPLKFNVLPINQYHNAYLGQLLQTELSTAHPTSSLKPSTNEIALLNEGRFNTNIAGRPAVCSKYTPQKFDTESIFAVDNAEENEMLPKELRKIHEPNIQYVNEKIQTSDSSSPITQEIFPLSKQQPNGFASFYPPNFISYNPTVGNIPLRASFVSMPSNSKSVKYFTDLPKRDQLYDISGKQISGNQIIGTKQLALNLISTRTPFNINYTPTSLKIPFLNNVLPTLINPNYEKIETSLPVLPMILDTTYRSNPYLPVAPFSFSTNIPVTPPQDKTTDFNLSTVTIQPQSTIKVPYKLTPSLMKQRPCTSETQNIPKSKYISYRNPLYEKYSIPEKASSSPDSQTVDLMSVEPVPKDSSNENIVTIPYKLPCSGLRQDQHIHTPILSSADYFKPNPKSILSSKKYDTPTTYNSESAAPEQPLIANFNYLTLPDTTIPLTTLYQPKTSFNKALPQNIIKWGDEVPQNSIFSTPELSVQMPHIKTQQIAAVNYPQSSLTLPVNANLVSNTQPQSTFSVTPDYYNNEPTSFYRNKCSTINYYSPKCLSTLSSRAPLDLYFPHNPASMKTPIISPAPSQSQNLSKLRNNKAGSAYFPTDVNPLFSQPNYLTTAKFGNINMNPRILLNPNNQWKTQPQLENSIENVCPTFSATPFTSHQQENPESTPLSFSETSSFPRQRLTPYNLNSIVSTQSNSDSIPENLDVFSENLGTHMPISTSHISGNSPNIVPSIPADAISEKPDKQLNILASIYSYTPTVKPMLWSTEGMPLKYRLPYELPSQETFVKLPTGYTKYTEPKVYYHTAPLGSPNILPNLALRPNIQTTFKLGLLKPETGLVNNLYTKPSATNNIGQPYYYDLNTPIVAPNVISPNNPLTCPQSEVTSTPSSLNNMAHPVSVLNPIFTVPSFEISPLTETDSLKYNFNELSTLESNKLFPTKDKEIPGSYATPSHLAVTLSSASVSPFDLKTASIPSDLPLVSTENLPKTSFYPHLLTPVSLIKSNPNNLNVFRASIPCSKAFHVKNPDILPNFGAQNLPNVTPISHNYNAYLSEPNRSFSNLQTQAKLSQLNLQNVFPIGDFSHGHKSTTPLLSVNPISTEPYYVSQQFAPYPSVMSSSIKLPYSVFPNYLSENLPSLPLKILPDTLPIDTMTRKTITPPIQTSNIQDSNIFSSAYTLSKPLNDIASQIPLKSTNNPYFSYYYKSYPEEKPIDHILNLNSINYYPSATQLKYDNVCNKGQTTPILMEKLLNPSYIINEPYLKTLEEDTVNNMELPKVCNRNEMNNNLIRYIKKLDAIPNVLKEKTVAIPLNIGIYEPANTGNISYIKTENPDIGLKVWPAAVKILKAEIVFETDELESLNFCPILYGTTKYSNEEIQGIIEEYVKMHYGKPIVIKTINDSSKESFIDNIDGSFIRNGKVYIIWANICNCGCGRIGCQCSFNKN